MSERPWMKFFPADWRADPALRMCSIGARGLWMEMLCLMHEADPRGHLLVNGMMVGDNHIAMLAGLSIDEAKTFLQELEKAGVFSRSDEGVILSRRMIREAKVSERAKANGSKGGNPDLVSKDKAQVNPQDNQPDNHQANPYIASSIWEETYQSAEGEKGIGSPRASAPAARIEFAGTFWPNYPNRVGKRAAVAAFVAARQRASLAEIMDGLHRYKSDKPPDRPWLNPATFLNQDRWNDEPAPNPTKPPPDKPHDAIFRALAERTQAGAGQGRGPPVPDGRLLAHRRGEDAA